MSLAQISSSTIPSNSKIFMNWWDKENHAIKILNSIFSKETSNHLFTFSFAFLGYTSSYLIGYWLVDWQVWKTLQGSSLERTWKAIYIPWSNLNTLKQPPLTLNTPSCSLRLYNLLKAQTKFSVRMSPSTKNMSHYCFNECKKIYTHCVMDKIISVNIFMASVPNCLSISYILNKL